MSSTSDTTSPLAEPQPTGGLAGSSAARPRRLGEAEGDAVATPAGARLLLNDTAAAVWELCDGQTQVVEIVAAMGELYSASLATIERDVWAALRELQRLGLVQPLEVLR